MADLETRLWTTALQLAREAGMEFTVPCSHNVRDFIQAGARVMRRQNRTSEPDLEEADASLGRAVQEMIRTARALEPSPAPGGTTLIRESALVRAKVLCPLWPFC